EVYNNDGPGFEAKIIRSEGYLEMRERIRTLVPQLSVVGMLMEHEASYEVVQSSQSLFMQHDPFSWEVLGDRFIRADQLAKESVLVEVTLKSWLNQLSRSERKQFIDALFQIFLDAEVWTV